ncbi:MAG TPA: tetratricopeptide repeat protein [Bacteroidota bacterium]|nr:tetratricopeptide repeat protein [Bacteroidota bacterium]
MPASPLFARLAQEYLTAGRTEDAKQLCITGLQVYPSYATAHLVLAKCYHADSNVEKALESLQDARSLLPDSSYLSTLHEQWSGVTATALPEPESKAAEPAPPPPEPETMTAVGETVIQTLVESPPTVQTIEEVVPQFTEEVKTVEPVLTAPVVEEPPAPSEEIVPQFAEELKTFEPIVTVPVVEEPPAPIQEDSLPELHEEQPFPTSVVDELELREIISREDTPAADGPPEEAPLPEPSFPSVIDELQLDEIISKGDIPLEESPALEEPGASPSPEPEVFSPPVVVTTVLPPPSVEEPVEEKPSEPFDDEGRIVTKTLAEIYASQGAYSEAILTYQLLKTLRPSQSAEYDRRIKELEPKVQDKSGSTQASHS